MFLFLQGAASDIIISSSCSVGGYDYLFVDQISSKYQCNICMKVLRHANLTGCCGQHYCDSCLKQWKDKQGKKYTCPHCRREGFQSMLNWEKIREIKLLRIRCTNLKKGCEWVGQLEDLRNHLQSDSGCDYEDVKCSNKGYEWEQLRECGKMVERRFVAHHQYHDCSYREYTCGKVDTYDAIAGTRRIKKTMPSLFASVKLFFTSPPPTNHYATCQYFPLECPNECGEKDIKRRDVETHLNVCTLQPLEQIL